MIFIHLSYILVRHIPTENKKKESTIGIMKAILLDLMIFPNSSIFHKNCLDMWTYLAILLEILTKVLFLTQKWYLLLIDYLIITFKYLSKSSVNEAIHATTHKNTRTWMVWLFKEHQDTEESNGESLINWQ